MVQVGAHRGSCFAGGAIVLTSPEQLNWHAAKCVQLCGYVWL